MRRLGLRSCYGLRAGRERPERANGEGAAPQGVWGVCPAHFPLLPARLPALILLGSCGMFREVMRKVAKVAAIEAIEEFAIFAGSLNFLRPTFDLPSVLLIFA